METFPGSSSEGKIFKPKPSSLKCPEEDAKVIENDKAIRTEIVQVVEEMLNQKSEDNGREISEGCLGIPTILRRILEQFSDKELIKVSTVNKLWNYEARSVLRDRGCLKATINLDHSCQRLVDFASDLEKMRVVPFAGIHLRIQRSRNDIDRPQSLSSESMDLFYQSILDQLPWKNFSVNFEGDLEKLEDSPAIILVQKILEDYCGVLEELAFKYSGGYYVANVLLVEFFLSIFQYLSFPCLKNLKCTGRTSSRRQIESFYSPVFVKAVVSSAPSLEQLYLGGPITFQENVMEGSSAVLFATSGLRPSRGQFCESLIQALRTESIELFLNLFEIFDLEYLNRFVPMLLQASITTLKTLRMDLLYAVPLMCYGSVFENVMELQIRVPDPTMATVGMYPQILALAKNFDFTRVFPRVGKVEIGDHHFSMFSPDAISEFFDRGSAVAREALPDRAINIKSLALLYHRKDSPPPLMFLSQMFPHVKIFSVKTYFLQEFPFAHLWEHFGCSEELHINFYGHHSPATINLDSAFCGLFPEEVEELRAKDDTYLKAVNIVPVMPSITCMRGLRLFTLRLRYELHEPLRQDSTRMFSKVTCLIGFPRCPALSVKFQLHPFSRGALDHLKPYVTVVTEDWI